jgi:prolyl-tRNA synthetase
VLPKCEEIRDQLRAAGIRVKLDADDSNTPGWKFSEYEMRGVPLRLEIGPKDIEKASVFAARRDTRAKQSLPMEGLAERIKALLDEIQLGLFDRARGFRDSHTTATSSYEEFKQIMEGRPGFVQSPWCGSAQCEAAIKAETQATIRNIPFGFEQAPAAPCVKCNGKAVVTAWFAKAY